MLQRIKILNSRLLQVTQRFPRVYLQKGQKAVDVETHIVPLAAIQRVTHSDEAIRIYPYAQPTPFLCGYEFHERSESWKDFQMILEALSAATAPTPSPPPPATAAATETVVTVPCICQMLENDSSPSPTSPQQPVPVPVPVQLDESIVDAEEQMGGGFKTFG
jgi:hypothetical protein